MTEGAEALWSRAVTIATLLAVDPLGLRGITVRASAGPVRDLWLARLRALLPAGVPWRRMPPGLAEASLLGGLDLAATLAAGRPVAERGLLASADGGALVVPMAERLSAAVTGPLCATLDTQQVVLERDGLALRLPARFTTVLLDEGIADERAPAALIERLAFLIDLDGARPADDDETAPSNETIVAARLRLAGVSVEDAMLETLCGVGLAFGVGSLRVTSLALRAACAAAALAGRDTVAADDVTLAATLVIAPRATRLPAAASTEPETPDDAGSESGESETADEAQAPDRDDPDETVTGVNEDTTAALSDRIVEAAKAAIPAGLLAALTANGQPNRQAGAGRAGLPKIMQQRGRPAGVRRGMPGHGARLAVVETLRAAAPWQRLRRQAATEAPRPGRIFVRREDFRIARTKQRVETTTIFVVDASGSAALNRLAEVKGAVELILADCYVRRDSVALLAFRGNAASLILPPTRSLARAKRALAGQPGGGGTPLATAIDAAVLLADSIRRKGPTPLAVFLTDGRANIGRSGRPGRPEAEADALAAARAARSDGLASLLIDISPRPQMAAQTLALALGARYQPLPYADARGLTDAVLAAGAGAGNK